MVLDVRPVHGFSHPRQGHEALKVRGEVWHVGDAGAAALEVDHVDQIEAKQGRHQANVRLGQHALLFPDQPFSTFEVSLEFGKAAKQHVHGSIVRRLGAGKTSLVDAIVHGFVIRVDHRIDAFAQVGGTQLTSIGQAFLCERGAQHTDDVTAFVVDDGVVMTVPQHRNRSDTGRRGPGLVSGGVDVLKRGSAEQTVGRRPRLIRVENPTPIALHAPINNVDADGVLKPQQSPC